MSVMLSRKNRDIINEILVYMLYIVAVICAFWWISYNHITLSKLFGIKDSVVLDLSSLASILGIVSAALAIIISNRQQANKELQATRDQIYQQLELESINLFRYEIDNVELARVIWDDTITFDELQKDKSKAYQILQHLCLILNLFEMAVRFKRDGIMHDDVFKSWEVWIYDLCKSKIFLTYWYREGVKENYIKLFQNIIDNGLCCCHGKNVVADIVGNQNISRDKSFNSFRAVIKDYLA